MEESGGCAGAGVGAGSSMNANEMIEGVTQELSKKRSEAIEALVVVLLKEKGAKSVLEYELVEDYSAGDCVVRWYFRERPKEDKHDMQ